MDRYPYEKPPRWWAPCPNRLWIKFWKPLHRYQQIFQYRVVKIDVQGLEHLSDAVASQCGVLVTPNHAGHADSYLVMDALERLPGDYYVMTAWQVFALMGRAFRLAYRQHGCFSVDRESTDLKAYRQAVDVLARSSNPLVIFPEGEVYHLNDRVKPFRAGTLSIAATAVRRSGRPVACVPCALKYHYLVDPTPELLKVVERIEHKLGVGPGPSSPGGSHGMAHRGRGRLARTAISGQPANRSASAAHRSAFRRDPDSPRARIWPRRPAIRRARSREGAASENHPPPIAL